MKDKDYESWPVWKLWIAWAGSFVWPGSIEWQKIGAVIERKTEKSRS